MCSSDLERIVKRYNLDYIAFQEDNFFVDKERVKKICLGIIKRGLKFEWFAECRADYFKAGHISEEIWELAKKAGLHTLTIGAESGSELSLEIMKKDIKLEDTINAARICNAKGIIPAFSFIMGMPGEEKKEIYKTVDFICTLIKICPSMCSGINVFFPYPKCELTRGLVEKGLLKEPTTLSGWVKENDELMGMYINLYSKKNINRPWQKNFWLIQNISYYINLSMRYSEPEIRKFLKERNIRYYPYIFFRFLAKERMKHKFFSLTIDKWIYEKVNHIYSIFKHEV